MNHKLTNINHETKLGTCSICGPLTKLMKRGNQTYRCFNQSKIKHAENYNKRKIELQQSQFTIDQYIKYLLPTIKHRNSITFNLTKEYLIDLWNNQNQLCYYSNILMELPIGFSGLNQNYKRASLDKINPELGYTIGNVVWACCGCNFGKWLMTPEQYINLCKQVSTKFT